MAVAGALFDLGKKCFEFTYERRWLKYAVAIFVVEV